MLWLLLLLLFFMIVVAAAAIWLLSSLYFSSFFISILCFPTYFIFSVRSWKWFHLNIFQLIWFDLHRKKRCCRKIQRNWISGAITHVLRLKLIKDHRKTPISFSIFFCNDFFQISFSILLVVVASFILFWIFFFCMPFGALFNIIIATALISRLSNKLDKFNEKQLFLLLSFNVEQNAEEKKIQNNKTKFRHRKLSNWWIWCRFSYIGGKSLIKLRKEKKNLLVSFSLCVIYIRNVIIQSIFFSIKKNTFNTIRCFFFFLFSLGNGFV